MLANELMEHWPVSEWQHRKVLVGVSGGADSVALLCALVELVPRDRLVAAHYNHGWRGAASDADEAFVVHLCYQLGVECMLGHARRQTVQLAPPTNTTNQNDTDACVDSAMLAIDEVLASESRGMVLQSEETARDERYHFFIHSAYECGASYVATAHTADDRVETLLHNLFRGSGLTGAASLKMFRQLDDDLILVRPLIAKHRTDIVQYLNARHQTYCTDASNSDEQYARNYIRHQILPAVRDRYGDAEANLVSFSELVEEALGDIRLLARQWLAVAEAPWQARRSRGVYASNALEAQWGTQHFWVTSTAAVRAQPWTIIREALRLVWLERRWPLAAMTRRHWEALRAILSTATAPAGAGAHAVIPQTLAVFPGAVTLETAEGFLAIGRRPGPAETHITP